MGRRNTILVTGLTRIWAGITNIAEGLNCYGIDFNYFYLEKSKIYTKLNENIYRTTFACEKIHLRCLQYLKLLLAERPSHVEFYHHMGNPLVSIIELLITKMLFIPVVTVCTGAEVLKWSEHSRIAKLSIKLSFIFSKIVILKELYMKDYVNKYNIGALEKCHFVHNGVIIRSEPHFDRPGRVVLFLNTFKPFRNVDILIQAAKIVVAVQRDVRFVLVGDVNRRAQRYVDMISEYDLDSWVTILPFTNDPNEYYAQASMFILPADIVYCNNALLEAMERGVPPIVSNVQGADLIVDHLDNGIITEINAKKIADAILMLFNDERMRIRLAQNARQKVVRDFNEENRAKQLYELYRQKVWRRNQRAV
jgi:glycosyltransferase involved in cell wall biosynthesis